MAGMSGSAPRIARARCRVKLLEAGTASSADVNIPMCGRTHCSVTRECWQPMRFFNIDSGSDMAPLFDCFLKRIDTYFSRCWDFRNTLSSMFLFHLVLC